MSFIFDIDDSPSILSAPDRLAVNDDTSFRADDSEGEHFLLISSIARLSLHAAYPDSLVEL
jgi:hypothetical protein